MEITQEMWNMLMDRFDRLEAKVDKQNSLRSKIVGGLIVIGALMVPLIVEFFKTVL